MTVISNNHYVRPQSNSSSHSSSQYSVDDRFQLQDPLNKLSGPSSQYSVDDRLQLQDPLNKLSGPSSQYSVDDRFQLPDPLNKLSDPSSQYSVDDRFQLPDPLNPMSDPSSQYSVDDRFQLQDPLNLHLSNKPLPTVLSSMGRPIQLDDANFFKKVARRIEAYQYTDEPVFKRQITQCLNRVLMSFNQHSNRHQRQLSDLVSWIHGLISVNVGLPTNETLSQWRQQLLCHVPIRDAHSCNINMMAWAQRVSESDGMGHPPEENKNQMLEDNYESKIICLGRRLVGVFDSDMIGNDWNESANSFYKYQRSHVAQARKSILGTREFFPVQFKYQRTNNNDVVTNMEVK
jgi:hypothetical protein